MILAYAFNDFFFYFSLPITRVHVLPSMCVYGILKF